jgi:hypothetical protein
MLLPFALAMPLGHVGCDAANGPASGRRREPVTATPHKQRDTMKISLKFQDKTVTATLIDNETSRDFVSLLPLTLTLKDYAETEKISDLPRKLSTAGAPPGSDPSVGVIAYYAPWGNLAVFYKDFDYSSGLVEFGRIDSGVEALNVPGPLKVTIERIENQAPSED